MENENTTTQEDMETTQEVEVVPQGYYDTMLGSSSFQSFALSILLGMFIVYLMIKGMRR